MASAAPPPARLGAPPAEPVGHLASQNEEETCVFVIARNVSSNFSGGVGECGGSKHPRSSEDEGGAPEAPSAKAHQFGEKYHSKARDDTNVPRRPELLRDDGVDELTADLGL